MKMNKRKSPCKIFIRAWLEKMNETGRFRLEGKGLGSPCSFTREFGMTLSNYLK